MSAGVLFASPPSLNLGNIPESVPYTFQYFLANPFAISSGPVTIFSITSPNPDYAVTGLSFPITLARGAVLTVPCVVTPTVGGVDNTTFFIDQDGTGVDSYFVKAFSVAPVVGAIVQITGAMGPTRKVNTHTKYALNFQNPGSAAYNVNSVTIGLDQFGDQSFSNDVADNPAFPFTVNPGDSIDWWINFDPTEVGTLTAKATFHTNAAAPQDSVDVQLSAVVILLAPIKVLNGKTKAPFFGLPIPVTLSNDYDNPDLDNALVFNGSIWDSPGNEKVFRRGEIFYQNIGVCTGLVILVKAWRPSLIPPGFDSITQTIAIGDVSADESDRSAFFDVNLAGEIVVISISRTKGTGPCAITGFTPHFEDKGEKVEGQ